MPFPARDVDGLSDGGVAFSRETVRQHDVPDVREVPRLPAVPVDGQALARERRLDEPRDDRGVLRRWILPRSEHVEVAERDGGQPVHPGEDAAVLLGGQLRHGIGRHRPGREIFALHRRAAVAVDRRGGGVDHAAAPGVARGAQHVEGSVDVHAIGGERVVDRARHRAERGLVEDPFDAAHRGLERALVEDVRLDHLDPVEQAREVLEPARREIVEHTHRAPAQHELLDQMRTDESCSTRDQVHETSSGDA